MTLGDFRRLTADLPDDCLILARDRDSSMPPEQFHVIGFGNAEDERIKSDKYSSTRCSRIQDPADMYGGKHLKTEGIEKVIVICGCN